jgi:hypothetical protein
MTGPVQARVAKGASGNDFTFTNKPASPTAQSNPENWSKLPKDNVYRQEWDAFAKMLGMNGQSAEARPVILDAIGKYHDKVMQAQARGVEPRASAKMDAVRDARAENNYQKDVSYLRSKGFEIGTGNGGAPLSRKEVSAFAAEHRRDVQRVMAAIETNRNAAIKIEKDYDAQHGPGAYKQHLANEAAKEEALGNQIKAAQNRAVLELLGATIIGPALLAAAAIAAPALAAAAPATVGRVVALLPGSTAATTSLIATPTVNAAIGTGAYLLIEDNPTVGGTIGAASTGALFGPVFSRAASAGQPIVMRVFVAGMNGAKASAAGDVTGQFIDFVITPDAKLSGSKALWSAFGGFLGGGGGALIPQSAKDKVVGLLPKSFNNYDAVLKGLATKVQNGTISNVSGTVGAKTVIIDLTKESPEKVAGILGDLLADMAKGKYEEKFSNANSVK